MVYHFVESYRRLQMTETATSTRDPSFDILFEPVKIGPVIAKNRFYQVPHCNGMGRSYPSSMAEMRRIKAEGGWAVICTEEVEIHPTADHSPWMGGRLWDDSDIPVFARMSDGIHEFDSLAAIELNHGGLMAPNRYSREIPMAPSHAPVATLDPLQARQMDKYDIRNLRRWHVNAARRAQRAGFDIVYVYAAHQLSTISHFMSRERNQRSDEYGGSLENRARLLKEVLQDTKDAVGDTCAVALRFSVDELRGAGGITCDGEGRDLIEMLAEVPDLWDVNISAWENDSATSRFEQPGYQDSYVKFVKTVTSKPVVGVGRYTSPDAMASLIKNGSLDFIGAARPSIADPYLPKKIKEGRIDDIRECIGCNICVSSDNNFVPIRCTQNPTMGEEWRRGWHPERIPPANKKETVLIVGAGPAGLEAARALGQRGYEVSIAEKSRKLGGRLVTERLLPGLTEWGRVIDNRIYQLSKMPNVECYLQSHMSAQSVMEFEAEHVVIATGSRWRDDGKGRENAVGIELSTGSKVLTPNNILETMSLKGPVIVFDDDHYYLGGVIADKLRQDGLDVTLVTPATEVSAWTQYTLEQHKVQSHLLALGVKIVTAHNLKEIKTDEAILECIYTLKTRTLRCATSFLVTMRDPADDLYHELVSNGLPSITRIGDCLAPSTIAAAVYSGHRFSRELGEPEAAGVPFRRELPAIAETTISEQRLA